jgi:hypothetical protein
MNYIKILITLISFVAITANAQLTDWQNISSKNFVTKITLDPKREPITRARPLRRPSEQSQHCRPVHRCPQRREYGNL